MPRSAANTVDAYLKELPAEKREVLTKVRDVVKKNLPKGYEELMGYGMIMWSVPLAVLPDTYNGHPQLYAALAAQKNYFAIYLMSVYVSGPDAKEFREAYKKTGKKLDMGKSCVRFKKIDDLPLDLIAKEIASMPMDKFIAFTKKARGE